MGATIIKDGAGSGNTVKVSSNNRLRTASVSTMAQDSAATSGLAFNHNTDLLTHTDGGEYAAIYLRNDSTNDYVVNAVAFGIGILGGTVSELVEATVVRNPTAGSIITNASAVPINANRNFGSPRSFTGLAYKGGQGETFTDGTDAVKFLIGGSSRLFSDTAFVLPQGTAVGVNVKLNASGGGQYYVALVGYEDTSE